MNYHRPEGAEEVHNHMLLIYLAVINIVTFAAFGMDKRAAVKNKWRTRESTLLGLCAIGGAIGGLTGMYVFHHKTKKPAFSVGIPIMIVIHILLILAFSNLIFK